MVDPVFGPIVAGVVGQSIKFLCIFIYNMLKRKKKLKREKAALEELAKEAQKELLLADKQAKRDQQWKAKLKKQKEELESEKRARIVAETKREMEADYLRRFVPMCIKLFVQLMTRTQHQSCARPADAHSRCQGCENQSKGDYAGTFEYLPDEYQSYAIDFGPFDAELNEEFDDDEEILNIFTTSMIQDGNQGQTFDEADESLDEQSPKGSEDVILSLVLATLHGNTPPGGTDHDEAKEEGNAYYKEQKFDEAIKSYTKSIDILPTAAAYGNRAMVYLKLNKYAEAEDDCTKALRLDDKYFKVYARRAIARKSLGHNFGGALDDVEFALQLEPADLEMKKLRAQLMDLIS